MKSGEFGEIFSQKILWMIHSPNLFFGSPSGQNSPKKKNPDLGFMFSWIRLIDWWQLESIHGTWSFEVQVYLLKHAKGGLMSNFKDWHHFFTLVFLFCFTNMFISCLFLASDIMYYGMVKPHPHHVGHQIILLGQTRQFTPDFHDIKVWGGTFKWFKE